MIFWIAVGVFVAICFGIRYYLTPRMTSGQCRQFLAIYYRDDCPERWLGYGVPPSQRPKIRLELLLQRFVPTLSNYICTEADIVFATMIAKEFEYDVLRVRNVFRENRINTDIDPWILSVREWLENNAAAAGIFHISDVSEVHNGYD